MLFIDTCATFVFAGGIGDYSGGCGPGGRAAQRYGYGGLGRRSRHSRTRLPQLGRRCGVLQFELRVMFLLITGTLPGEQCLNQFHKVVPTY